MFMLLVGVTLAQTPSTQTEQHTRLKVAGSWQEGKAICDSSDPQNPQVVLLTAPQNQQVQLWWWNKKTPHNLLHQQYHLGEPEGAAGSVYEPLVWSGAATGDAYLRSSQPGAQAHPERVFTTPYTSIRWNNHTVSCRWFEGITFMGVTQKRSVYITLQTNGQYQYQTFDFASNSSKPSLTLKNGKTSGGDNPVYTFTNGRYVYRVHTASTPAVEVFKSNRLLLKESFVAFTTAQP
ncbi:hypothetical protein GCM10008938_22390 [Deinococcus roseus]|uniref:Uncharacterized protein n=2 Tax=Deinococcus roseus TaxID=392414 RepID=A0ABQ2CZC5_9DEIO|nr:hypothetical protein GCM10008938_22390 [Deinococcus roseus]